MSLLHRPMIWSKTQIIKDRLKTKRHKNYNFSKRIKYYPANWGFNQKVLGDMFEKFHYYACHAPNPIRKHWKNAYENFYRKHFLSKGRASLRYLNKYTCYKWM